MAWWRDVWTSEVHDQYINVDRQGLVRLAILVDLFWSLSDEGGNVADIAREIRLQQQAFGLTPLDRARLQWQIEQEAEKDERREEEEPEIVNFREVARALK